MVKVIFYIVLSMLVMTQVEAQASLLRQCVNAAAARYDVDAQLLWAIKKVESGNEITPAIRHNKNGSQDFGPMQVNSIWLPQLKRYGITKQHLMKPCTNIHVGAWILASRIQRFGVIEGIGRYHSTTPHLKLAYIRRVLNQYSKIHKKHIDIYRAR